MTGDCDPISIREIVGEERSYTVTSGDAHTDSLTRFVGVHIIVDTDRSVLIDSYIVSICWSKVFFVSITDKLSF